MKKLEIIMDVQEIRRLNLEYLISITGDLKRVAEKSDLNADYLSQVRSKVTNKNMGNNAARSIEKGFGKERGWMDRLHGLEETAYSKYNSDQILELAVRSILNKLISSKIIEVKKTIDTEAISSMIASEYLDLCEKTGVATKPLISGSNQA